MNRFVIGSVTAKLTPDEVKITTDDRQELVKTLVYSSGEFSPGISVVDGGYCSAGAVMALSGVKFSNVAAAGNPESDWQIIYGAWTARSKVTVVDCAGNSTANCRVVLKGWTQNKKFSGFVLADLEIWQV